MLATKACLPVIRILKNNILKITQRTSNYNATTVEKTITREDHKIELFSRPVKVNEILVAYATQPQRKTLEMRMRRE